MICVPALWELMSLSEKEVPIIKKQCKVIWDGYQHPNGALFLITTSTEKYLLHEDLELR